MALSYNSFLQTLPEVIIPRLPAHLQGIKVRQPWRWLVQFHYGEPNLHYEVVRADGRPGIELGFHCEAKDHDLNRFLLDGFRRHLFEIKDVLGPSIEAEMWDRGWTKIYEVYPEGELTAGYQAQVGGRLVEIITCLHPIFVELRGQVARIYR
ncbi:MAG: hypothetical protein L0332_04810 [Chloroflexi bacterium]|nr:hypothetical protein [Chloroflexota bacterium]MCI0580092.1 hypothetical protein [Chloroflexota bacterium]MCI0649332.1 hypothetical protein [Chloroflexota bacterium]MCI0726028.1 hypothetical protein [Chloroflexota bacterium]